jgi:hypothetical protein
MRESNPPKEFKTGSLDPESPEFAGHLTFQGSITPPSHTITFWNHANKKVGTFNFSNSPATFEGDVDESAKSFTEAVLKHFEYYYKPQLEKEIAEQIWERVKNDFFKWKVPATDVIQWDKLEKIIKNTLV